MIINPLNRYDFRLRESDLHPTVTEQNTMDILF